MEEYFNKMNISRLLVAKEFYDGSLLLEPLADVVGIPIDQINFVASQLMALALGFVYREFFGPDRTSSVMRHWIQIVTGSLLAYFCFGRHIIHLFAQSYISYLLLRYLEPGRMEKSVLVFSIAYLCFCHVYRTVYDYGGYTLDITGPLMLNTQRVSSLAFGVRDGSKNNYGTLTPNLQRHAVRQFPSILEFSSYVFSFHGLMCGPFCFYTDYIAFIHGTTCKISQDCSNNTHELNSLVKKQPPGLMRALCQKLLTTFVFGISTICILPRYPKSLLVGPEFAYHSFLHQMFLLVLYTTLQHQKYFFAWKLGESVNTSAGLGFSGYNDLGEPCWNLIDNANIWKVEFSTSLKEFLDYWNRSTTLWLRYVIYNRTQSTVAVSIFSALWHGFYAGYYLTFLTGALFILTARLVRRNIRPLFQTYTLAKYFYDFLTFMTTRIAIAYLGFPFLILEFWSSVTIYSGMSFWMHAAAILLSLSILVAKRFFRESRRVYKERVNNSNNKYKSN